MYLEHHTGLPKRVGASEEATEVSGPNALCLEKPSTIPLGRSLATQNRFFCNFFHLRSAAVFDDAHCPGACLLRLRGSPSYFVPIQAGLA